MANQQNLLANTQRDSPSTFVTKCWSNQIVQLNHSTVCQEVLLTVNNSGGRSFDKNSRFQALFLTQFNASLTNQSVLTIIESTKIEDIQFNSVYWSKEVFFRSVTLFFVLLGFLNCCIARAENDSKALIIDGQNNHEDWPKTTAMMKQYLEDFGGFKVDVNRTQFTWKGKKHLNRFGLDDGKSYENVSQPKPDSEFNPNFSDYQVVVSNFGYNAAPWPTETQKSFEKYVADGGGLVIVHAADNSFGDWREFNLMIGLGGWGGRNEKSGPYVYLNSDGKTIRDESLGAGGGHGPQHEFQLVIRNNEHPICKGLPDSWLHAKDELYHGLRGPGENMKILATAFSAKKFGGTDRHEPMIMTIDYGQGRVFHTPMGHADYSMECVGFITTFVRGTQWCARKELLMEIPDDFPTRDKSSSRKFKSDQK